MLNPLNNKKKKSEIPMRGAPSGNNLQSFYYYLKDNKLAERTIEGNVKDIQRFYEWAREVFSLSPSDKRASGEGWERSSEGEGSGIERINYNELLKYVQHLKSQSLSIHTINIQVNSLRKYYDHLKEEGVIEKNPARHLHIKGQTKRVIENPLTYTQLETLYNQYTEYSRLKRSENPALIAGKNHQTRSLVILGLMIWQGLHSGEIEKLQVEHIKLNEGNIYIPSTRRSNSRELKLDARQIITLHKYITPSQPPPQGEELQEVKGVTPRHSTSLLRREDGREVNVHNLVFALVSQLKGINPQIKNPQHIRASVILHWIKMYGKRQVQYMAGHKYISSTQNYEVQELDSLTDLLAKHHPFN